MPPQAKAKLATKELPVLVAMLELKVLQDQAAEAETKALPALLPIPVLREPQVVKVVLELKVIKVVNRPTLKDK